MTVQLWLNSASILIAGLALASTWVQSIRQARAQLLVNIGGEFREGWRERWRHLPDAVKEAGGDPQELNAKQHDDLMEALNWLDWFGVACRRGVVTNHDFIYETIGLAIDSLLTAGDKETRDRKRWSGISYLRDDLDNYWQHPSPATSLRARQGRLARNVRIRGHHGGTAHGPSAQPAAPPSDAPT